MICNVSCAINFEQLNSLIEIRKRFKYEYTKNLNERTGQNFGIPKCKIIVVDDMIIKQDNYIGGSILLPDARAMYSLIEGDYYSFKADYQNKIYNDVNVREYLIILLSAFFCCNFLYFLSLLKCKLQIISLFTDCHIKQCTCIFDICQIFPM